MFSPLKCRGGFDAERQARRPEMAVLLKDAQTQVAGEVLHLATVFPGSDVIHDPPLGGIKIQIDHMPEPRADVETAH